MKGARRIGPADPEWPPLLNELGPHRIPEHLNVTGVPLSAGERAVAIVGARDATVAGLDATEELATGLAQAGFAVVSGLARGIDAAAHRAALDAGGYTIAVLGCGLDVAYPRANSRLKAEVAERGTLVSEHPAGTLPKAFHFPERNRIIAGLCAATIVVEGALKSGALITARIALDANRQVFAVPGSIRNPVSAGPNELIRTAQAALVTDVSHVFEELAPDLAWREPVQLGLGASSPDLDNEHLEVLNSLDDAAASTGRLARATGLSQGRLALVLSHLEIRGLAIRRPGGYAVTRTGAMARGRITHAS